MLEEKSTMNSSTEYLASQQTQAAALRVHHCHGPGYEGRQTPLVNELLSRSLLIEQSTERHSDEIKKLKSNGVKDRRRQSITRIEGVRTRLKMNHPRHTVKETETIQHVTAHVS